MTLKTSFISKNIKSKGILTDFSEHLLFTISYNLIDLEVREVPQYVCGALLKLLELLLAAVIRNKHDLDGRLVIPVHEDRESALLGHTREAHLIESDYRGLLLL
jgi:hypothetical protein